MRVLEATFMRWRFATVGATLGLAAAAAAGCSRDSGPAATKSEPIGQAKQAIIANGPNIDFDALSWLPVKINKANAIDVSADSVTANERDIVGDATHPAAYIAVDAQRIYVRLRIGGNPVTSDPTKLKNFGWGCGFDTNNNGANFESALFVKGPEDVTFYNFPSTSNLGIDFTSVSTQTALYTALSGATMNNNSVPHVRAKLADTTKGVASATPGDYFLDFAGDQEDFVNFNGTIRLVCSSTSSGTTIDDASNGDILGLTGKGTYTISDVITDPINCSGTTCTYVCTTDSDCGGTTPLCDTNAGACVPCNGDSGSGANHQCPNTTSKKYCNTDGSCGTCTDTPTACVDETNPRTIDHFGGTCGAQGCFCNSGECGPTCDNDADCGSGKWCNDTNSAGNNVCQNKTANGSAITNATCSVAARACTSGVCDTDNKCGLANGSGTCDGTTAATVCRSGVCDADSKCGLANGSGTCDGTTAATLCRSSVCDTTSGKCAQCTSSNLTNCSGATPVCSSTNSCVGCDADKGAPSGSAQCPSTGSPYCKANGSCDTCTNNGSCTETISGKIHAGSFCSSGGACVTTCTTDADCTPSQFCDTANAGGTCTAKESNGNPIPGVTPPACASGLSSRCLSGVCGSDNNCGYPNNSGTCSTGDQATVCRSQVCSAATGGTCVQCTSASASACTGTTPVCGAGNSCVACGRDNGVTGTNACPTTSNPYCNANGSCGDCTNDASCTSGSATHAGTFCKITGSGTVGTCVTKCATDSQCAAGQWCNDITSAGDGVCQAKVPNGDLIPDSGICATYGARACVSGVCDADNKCGLRNGSGACNTTTGPTICRSTICAPNATCAECVTNATCPASTPVCEPSTFSCKKCNGDNGAVGASAACPATAPYCNANGTCGKCGADSECKTGTHNGPFCNETSGACGINCSADADCPQGQWCNNLAGAANAICQPKTPTGVGIPGTACNPDIAARACADGICDPVTGTCGTRIIPPPDDSSVEGGGVGCSTSSSGFDGATASLFAIAAALLRTKRRSRRQEEAK